jgi:hypothetical protein
MMRSSALLWVLIVFVLQVQAATPRCHFTASNGEWTGSCGLIEGHESGFVLKQAASLSSGVWRKDSVPILILVGKTFAKSKPDESGAVEIEFHKGGIGVMRTGAGWWPVTDFTRVHGVVRFNVDESERVPPSALDRAILEEAQKTLSSEDVWDRADDRKCSDEDKTWSIYCAMERACVKVTGGADHRRPALRMVRQVIDERSNGRGYAHRLMDYNNDPKTTLQDVQSLFADSLIRLKQAMK